MANRRIHIRIPKHIPRQRSHLQRNITNPHPPLPLPRRKQHRHLQKRIPSIIQLPRMFQLHRNRLILIQHPKLNIRCRVFIVVAKDFGYAETVGTADFHDGVVDGLTGEEVVELGGEDGAVTGGVEAGVEKEFSSCS